MSARGGPDWGRLRRDVSDVAIGVATAARVARAGGERSAPVRDVEDGIAKLALRVAARDSDGTREAARELAGRGPGLTPVGDDVLVGALYALWAADLPDSDRERLCRAIVDGAAGRTTTLSTSWIRAAARGEAGRDWLPLIAALPTCSDTCTEAATIRILSTGHSSGAAALAGFLEVWSAVGRR